MAARRQLGEASMAEEAADPATLPNRIHEPLDHWARHRPDAPALVEDGGLALSYAGLRGAAGAIATILRDAGVRGGDRVMIVNENSIAAVATLFAASLLDAWAVMVNARLAPPEVDRIREHARPRAMVFTHDVSAEAAAHAARHKAGEAITTPAGSIRLAGHFSSEPEAVAASGALQTAAVIYTSGTTGNPKGAML